MRGFFSTLVGKLAGLSFDTVGHAIHSHFAPLDKAQPGLSRKVSAYVADGRESSVLATLATQAVRTAWGAQRISRLGGPVRTLLAAADGEAVLVRYGEALAALEPAPQNSRWSTHGTALAPDWLRHAVSVRDNHKGPTCPAERLARIAALGGASPGAVLDILFHVGPSVDYGTQHSLDKFPGAEGWLAANVAAVSEHQALLDAPARVELAQAIGRFGLVEPYLDLLVTYGVSTAKTVRAAAMKALTAAPRDRLVAALDTRYGVANAGTRAELVALALGALGADARPLLARWGESEGDRRTSQALERGLAGIAASEDRRAEVGPWESGYVALDGTTVALPPHVGAPEPSCLPAEVYDLLRPSIDSYNACVRHLQEAHRDEKRHRSRSWSLIDSAELDDFRRIIEGEKRSFLAGMRRAGLSALHWGDAVLKFDRSGIAAFYVHPAVTLRHLVSILRAEHSQRHFWWTVGDMAGDAPALELRRRLRSVSDVQQLADLWVEMGGRPPVAEYLEMSWGELPAGLDRSLLWPLVAESLELIDEALGMRPQSGKTPLSASRALDLLALLPKVPHRYLLPLMTLATGSQKVLRQRARDLLAGAPNIDAGIEALLSDGKGEVRAGAADWLAARGAKASIPTLRKALRKEKGDAPRAAIISALERLGDDVSDCFNPTGLLAEATAGLGKASTKGLEWFPFALLPCLAWADGTLVDPAILRWWVVLAHKLKQPGGNALLDLWLERLKPEDARCLGLFVLRSWTEQDARTMSEDDANAYAAAHVDAQLRHNQHWARQNPRYADYYVTDRDKLFAQLKRQKLGEYLGSAVDSKGILALASRAEGADAAAVARAYLRDHGSRVSQAKAVLDALAANPAPAAIQVVLATANRFKARTVQEHARALVVAIAERRGWTAQELADRTIPTAGLDACGEAELDCGEGRAYRLALDASDALVLLNAAGQSVKALPAARGEAEKPLIDTAKKQLATARKELKQVVAAQTERLYEAMCLSRCWPARNWERHLLRHPIVGRLLRRLVWIGLDADGRHVTLFRPLDDGSLSDADDRAVDIATLAQVQLAHSHLVADDVAEAWRTHLADYEVAAPFEQFARDLPRLDDKDRASTMIDDRRGWMIETFKLRGIATKLGFVRGTAGDGGWVSEYERRYEAAGLVAVIGFTGTPLPEENIPAALHELRFARLRSGGGWYGSWVPLGEVPPVLLAETWRTLHRIAAAGTGYDPDWEKKSGW